MAETIIKGYLFKKINYGVFDEIISFISPNNHKYSCLSKGSKKIESKNGRNLFLGDFIEFEIFESRSEDKLNRLKKAITVDHED
jgi:DNA repair protein RecO (recombination protein O)